MSDLMRILVKSEVKDQIQQHIKRLCDIIDDDMQVLASDVKTLQLIVSAIIDILAKKDEDIKALIEEKGGENEIQND